MALRQVLHLGSFSGLNYRNNFRQIICQRTSQLLDCLQNHIQSRSSLVYRASSTCFLIQ